MSAKSTISETNEDIFYSQFQSIIIIKIKQKFNKRLYYEVCSIK